MLAIRCCVQIGASGAAITIFEASKVLGQDLLASCDWVIKLDPDCVFVPNAAKEFVCKPGGRRAPLLCGAIRVSKLLCQKDPSISCASWDRCTIVKPVLRGCVRGCVGRP